VLHLLKTNPTNDALENLFTRLTNSIYDNSSVAYFYDHADNIVPNLLACAIGLDAFLLKGETNNTHFGSLLSYVSLAGSDTIQPWWRMSGEQIGHFMLALANSDLKLTFKTPDITISAKNSVNGQFLFSSSLNSAHPLPYQTTLFFENIPKNITAEASGVGESSIIFGASYIPLSMSRDKINHGIDVDRFIQAVDPITYYPIGDNLMGGYWGQLVVTTIQIYLRDYSSGIKIIDYFPGTMFPLIDTYQVPYAQKDSYLTWFYTGGAFSHKEFLPDKIIFYGYSLYPGTYTVHYYSLLLYIGNFSVPPAVAYDILAPQVRGSSQSGWFSLGTPLILPPIPEEQVNCLPWENREIPMDKLDPYLGIFPGEPTPQSQSDSTGLIVGLIFFFLILLALVIGIVYRFFYYTPKKEEMYTL